MKTLVFHDNTNKPPFHGTFSKRTAIIRPRKPFAMASAIVDYECDSDEEWEEEDPGEDLEDEQLLKEEEGGGAESESDDLAIVPDGYLSADEGAFGGSENESGNEDVSETAAAKDAAEDPIEAAKKRRLRKLLHEEAKKNMYLEPRREMLDKLITLRIGPIFDESKIRDDPKSAILAEFSAMPLVSLPCNVDAQAPPTTPGNQGGNAGEGLYSPKLKQFPEALLLAFVRHIHGKADGVEKLLKEFQPPLDAGKMLSRRQLELKLKQTDFVRKERRGASGMDLMRWWVRPEVLAQYPSCADLLAALPPQSTLQSTLSPTAAPTTTATQSALTSPSTFPSPPPSTSAASHNGGDANEEEPAKEINSTPSTSKAAAPLRKYFAPKAAGSGSSTPTPAPAATLTPPPSPQPPAPQGTAASPVVISRATPASSSTPRQPTPGSPSTPHATPSKDPKVEFDELESALERFAQNDANLCVAKLRAFTNKRRMSAALALPPRSLSIRLADLVSSVSSDVLRREAASLLSEILPTLDTMTATEAKPWCMTWKDVAHTASFVVAATISLQNLEDAKLLASGFKLVEILMSSPVKEDIAELICTQPHLLSAIAAKISSAEAQLLLEKIVASPAGSKTLATDKNLSTALEKVIGALQHLFETTKSERLGSILEKLVATRSTSAQS